MKTIFCALFILIVITSFSLINGLNSWDNQNWSIQSRNLLIEEHKDVNYPSNTFNIYQIDSFAFVLYIVGTLYMFLAIWIVSMKYYYPCSKEIIYILSVNIDIFFFPFVEFLLGIWLCPFYFLIISQHYINISLNIQGNSESLRTFFFILTHGIIYIFIMFYSTFVTKDDIGIGIISGSEIINIFGIVAAITFKLKEGEEPVMDQWIFIRNSCYYGIGCCLFIGVFLESNIYWYMSLVLFLYTICYMVILWKSELLRVHILTFAGLLHEEEEAIAEEYMNMKRRCYDFFELKDGGYFNFDDPKLKLKLKQCSKHLETLNLSEKKLKIFSAYQRIGYSIIFAIRAKIESEKKDRSNYHRARITQIRVASTNEKDNQKKHDASQKIHIDEIEEDDDTSEKNAPIGSKNNQEAEEDNKNKKEEEDMNKDNNNNNNMEVKVDDNNINGDNNNNNNQYEDLKQIREEEDMSNIENDSISGTEEDLITEDLFTLPPGAKNKIFFLVQLPIKIVLYYIIPDYRNDTTLKRLIYSCSIMIGIIGALTYLTIWWMDIALWAIGIQDEVMGFNFGSIGFSIPFAQYMMREYKRSKGSYFEIGFLHFSALGIFKYGFAVGLAYLSYSLTQGATTIANIPAGFRILLFVYLAMMLSNIFMIFIYRLRILKSLWKIYIICCLGFWIIIWVFNYVFGYQYKS